MFLVASCYNDDPANCAKYGRLYDWETAKTVCPKGWHLPSDAEWTTLTDFAGGESTAGSKLKATSGWDEGGNGTDDYGFSALPGGDGGEVGFRGVGGAGYWLSATEYDAYRAWIRHMRYNRASVDRYYDGNKDGLYSVRCIQD